MAEYEDVISEEDNEDIQNYLNYVNRPRQLRIMREKPDHFEKWNDHDFYVRFRLSKTTVHRAIGEVRDAIASPTERNNALFPAVMVLLTIRFYATGSFLITVGDFAGIHKSTASRVVHKVSHAIAQLRPRYIKFPETDEEITSVTRNFYNIARFPRCVGSLDCTHVRIQSPEGGNAEIYRNRKGFFSINVQTIGDPDLKILNIVARWPGSTHDSTIFNNSNIRGKFERGELRDSVLVGDSGYPIKNCLITPLTNPNTRAENIFNESLIRTRNPVERKYGVWKQRFPVLALGILMNLERVEAVILATAVLHNIACEMHEADPTRCEDIDSAVNYVNNISSYNYVRSSLGPSNMTKTVFINEYFHNL